MESEWYWDPRTHHRRDDLETSAPAAESVKDTAGSLAVRCLAALQGLPGWCGTQTDVANVLGLDRGKIHRRMSDLKTSGAIEPTGLKRKGPTGRNETIWKVTPRGHRQHRAGTLDPGDRLR